MKTIKNEIGNEAFIFAKTFEYEAYDQIKKLINFPAYHESVVRVMPDAHAGIGCTVGTTMTIKDKITPNLVGVDIGCGMLTVRLNKQQIDFERLDAVIHEKVPYGFNVHEEPQTSFDFSALRCSKSVDLARAIRSLGSLGGGNHFIELGVSDKHGDLYLVIHSGSRKLGGDVCKHYQDKAFQGANEMSKIKAQVVSNLRAQGRHKEIDSELKKIQKPITDKDLAFLTGQDFKDYMNDMAIVQGFASRNRKLMAEIILRAMGLRQMDAFETIHNYIDFRRMILRKGAVSAEKNEIILIPINMRDGSLVARGLGNAHWNYSAPHGAGRLMSRSKAKENISMDEFLASMQGIYTSSAELSTLDEAPQAYKPIDEIQEAIVETAQVIDKIIPLYNFKAH